MEHYYRHFRKRKIYRFVTFATIEATEMVPRNRYIPSTTQYNA